MREPWTMSVDGLFELSPRRLGRFHGDHLPACPVVPQNLVRREIRAAMIAKVTQRTELGPLRALPTVRQARIERGMRLGLAQCAQLTPDFMWDRDFRSGCDYEVAVAAKPLGSSQALDSGAEPWECFQGCDGWTLGRGPHD
jgi:hypothetical protein